MRIYRRIISPIIPVISVLYIEIKHINTNQDKGYGSVDASGMFRSLSCVCTLSWG
jgi:hypothetical protein